MNTHHNIHRKTLIAAALAALLAGCASLPPGLQATQPYSSTVYQPGADSQTGGALGALAGGLLGHLECSGAGREARASLTTES